MKRPDFATDWACPHCGSGTTLRSGVCRNCKRPRPREECEAIEGMLGWGCCRCNCYNGLGRTECKHCPHVQCGEMRAEFWQSEPVAVGWAGGGGAVSRTGGDEVIDINELTLGQIKEIQSMCANAVSTPKNGAKLAAKSGAERPVIVCTDKRGVFFGYCADTTGDVIVMARARMCVYWDVSTKGVLGLSATGPTSGCRITASVPAIELRGITCVIECTPEATKAWEGAPWTK